jgi:hypothetical protein
MITDNEILGRDEKMHEVKPMLLKYTDKVISLSKRLVRDDVMFANIMPPKYENGLPVIDGKGDIVTDKEPYKAMIGLLEIATNERKTQIEEWCDLAIAQEILDRFYCISNLKKNMKEK